MEEFCYIASRGDVFGGGHLRIYISEREFRRLNWWLGRSCLGGRAVQLVVLWRSLINNKTHSLASMPVGSFNFCYFSCSSLMIAVIIGLDVANSCRHHSWQHDIALIR
jgi:hypothetical protein